MKTIKKIKISKRRILDYNNLNLIKKYHEIMPPEIKAKCYQILDTISFRIERQDYSHIIFKELRALKEELANVLEITANKKNAKAQE